MSTADNRKNNSIAQIEESSHPSGDYMSYLIRLWRPNEESSWIAYVEAAFTHDRRVFSSLAELFEFLEEQAGESGDQPAGE